MRQFQLKSRFSSTRQRKKIIVICCEGNNQTETLYFNNFRNRETIIKFSPGNETDPVGMVENLNNFLVQEDIKANDGKAYLLIDGDIDVSKQAQIDSAIKRAAEYSIEVILSNPCFEIWYLLHFIYTSKNYTSNQQLIKELKKYLPNYSKSADTFAQIKDYTNTAIGNSKKLEKFHADNGQTLADINCIPYTGVHKMIEYINSLR